MADPLRNDSGAPEHSTASLPPEPVLDDRSVDELLAGFPPDRTLPPPHNPRLNRTAETIGNALGTTVGRMRNGLSLVKGSSTQAGSRVGEKLSQTAADLKDKAADLTDSVRVRAQDLTATVRAKASELGDVAQDRTEQLMNTSQKQWANLRVNARERLIMARNRAAVLRQDHPLELIVGFAVSAFVIGFTLRIWRSSND